MKWSTSLQQQNIRKKVTIPEMFKRGNLMGLQNTRVTDKVIYGGCIKLKTGGEASKLKRLGGKISSKKASDIVEQFQCHILAEPRMKGQKKLGGDEVTFWDN